MKDVQRQLWDNTPDMRPRFDGDTFEPDLDGDRLAKQLARVLEIMSDGAWRTLGELGAQAQAPQASVSARLRDLRKKKFGGHLVERRRRGEAERGIFEYRLARP